MQVVCIRVQTQHVHYDTLCKPLVTVYLGDLYQVLYCRLSDHEYRVSQPGNADWIKFLIEKLFTELTC